MTRLLPRIGLPLLARELIEQAARKRTYVIRVVYASLLFLTAYLFFHNHLQAGQTSPLAILGRGRQMFTTLVALQFIGVYVFTPAMTCGVLTQEKERASLQLLFLTRLGPWTILFEKLLGRLVPMFGFLLLSLPLLAFAYTLGGLSPEYLWSGVWLLLISVLQMATVALACSAYFRTTVGAFIGSYLVASVMFAGPIVLWTIASIFSYDGRDLVWRYVDRGWWINQDLLLPDRTMLLWPFVGMALFLDSSVFHSGRNPFTVWLSLAVVSAPILAVSGASLFLARLFVVRRAFVQERNPLLDFFKSLDRAFTRFNDNRWTRGIVLVHDSAPLPVDEPVAWRETSRRSLGQSRYLFRILLAIELPLVILCLLLTIAAAGRAAEIGSYVIFFLWGLAVLLVSVHSASLIAGEKSHQTLDVLCTTPLTAREIILQKFHSVRRFILVLLIPFVTLFCFQCLWHASSDDWRPYGHQHDEVLYMTCSALSVGIYLPMVAWLSLWIGLKTRSQPRAIIGSLGAIVGWCIGPLVCCIMPFVILFSPGTDAQFTLLISPMIIIILNELNGLHDVLQIPWVGVIFNFVGYGVALAVFRGLCLNDTDRLLGRLEGR